MPIPTFEEAYAYFRSVCRRYMEEDCRILENAYLTAECAHVGQKKFGLRPYIIHPLSVFKVLYAELGVRDRDILAAALLHDVVEDCGITPDEIRRHFGCHVRELVEAVTTLPQPGEREADKMSRKLRHIFGLLRSGSREAIQLGIADKIDNLRNAVYIPDESPQCAKFRRWIAESAAWGIVVPPQDVAAGYALNNAMAALIRRAGYAE